MLSNTLQQCLGSRLQSLNLVRDELTVVILAEDLLESCLLLRDDPLLAFELLIDLCGVDYLHYGLAEWATDTASTEGFSRAVTGLSVVDVDTEPDPSADLRQKRFYGVYHLLSLRHNQRLRLKVFAPGDPPTLPSVTTIWNVANWYEREAYDLFGIIFENHPDLRRLLTDYGFVGHPFRKDFPLSGTVEVRYSAKDQRVVYEPVSIKPRILVPKIIRDDHRYKDLDRRPEQP
ncbi:MAG: NADH-quinone oxidoreductase subunit C [Gammaproteobacteria bacterium]|nr:NADH-quinone oxidoreductase subunit C [Gammaproteobacteria bacterium]MBP9728694.1 NADH-quinone oxidoreductase subunit C [Gammaproteobacteria bacterium]